MGKTADIAEAAARQVRSFVSAKEDFTAYDVTLHLRSYIDDHVSHEIVNRPPPALG